MEETIKSIRETVDLLLENLAKCETNKAAAARARKATLTLAKLGKQFRQESIAASKK